MGVSHARRYTTFLLPRSIWVSGQSTKLMDSGNSSPLSSQRVTVQREVNLLILGDLRRPCNLTSNHNPVYM